MKTFLFSIALLTGCVSSQRELNKQCDQFCSSKNRGACVGITQELNTSIGQPPILIQKRTVLRNPQFVCAVPATGAPQLPQAEPLQGASI